MLKTKTKRVTVHDVAKEAGVSAQTVSRVINNHKYISDKSRELVTNAMQGLGYIPNRAAQMLHTQTSNTLEIITFGDSPFKFQGPFAGMVKAAKAAGYHLSFAMSPQEEVTEALNSIVSRLIDGIVIIDTANRLGGEVPDILKNSVPYVFLGSPKAFRGPAVSYDHQLGAKLGAQYLLDLGHTTIAEIRGPKDDVDSLERHNAWRRLAKKHKLSVRLSREGDFSYKAGYEATLELLEQDAGFTALLVANDSMAVGAIKALTEREMRVPGDVSVVGFDNAAHAAYISPPLTTVAQNFDALGKASIDYLVERLEHPDAPTEHRLLEPILVVRESAAPPKGNHAR